MVVGSTGAGKTTHSLKIAKELSAVVYSIDNWMKELYGPDMPADPEPQWFYDNQKWYVDRIARCEEVIKKISLMRAQLGQPSLLDLGFATKSHRSGFIRYFNAHGIETTIHYLDVPAEVRKRRVRERNQARGETFVMTVDESLFDYMESVFEAPSEDEGAKISVIRGW